jgi:aspartate-semialdehyde dehydrogenase
MAANQAATQEQLNALAVQSAQTQAVNDKYNQELQAQKDRAISIKDNELANEIANNKAALASQQAENQVAIEEQKVANESAQIMAAYQINRLGLVLSTA